MMDINNGYDRWLTTPPDEPEASYCEYCNQEHEYDLDGDARCDNPFCPEKFEKYKGGTISVVLDMSEHLAEVEQELVDAKSDLKYAQARIANLTTLVNRQGNELDKLTQSQSNVVVRDTDYQIRRMEDAFDYHEDDCDPYAISVFRKEFAEIKNILQQGE